MHTLKLKRACMHLFYQQRNRMDISLTRNLEWTINTVAYTTNMVIL